MGRAAVVLGTAVAVATMMIGSVAKGAETSGNSKGFEVPVVDFDGDVFMKGMAGALAENGIIAVRNVPGLAQLRHDAFKAVVTAAEGTGCSGLNVDDEEVALKIKLQDETARTTFAAPVKPKIEEITSSLSRRLELVRGAGDGSCAAEVSKKVEELRSVLDQVAMKFASGLDSEILIPDEQALFESVDEKRKGGYYTFSELIEKGEHLDHLHIYEKRTSSFKNMKKTLDFHTDQGLFIAIIPALEFDLSSDGSVVERKNGNAIFEVLVAREDGSEEAKEIVLPDGGDVVLFMIGDGSEFMRRDAHKMLKPVPHALTMMATSQSSSRSARVWMGRMFFPPTDAAVVHPETGEVSTFSAIKQQWKQQSQKESQDPSEFHGMGCSSTPFKSGDSSLPFNYRRRVLAGTSCGSGEMYCWHSCLSIAALPCNSTYIQCMNFKTGLPWDGVSHCNCGPQCVTSAPTTITPTTSPTTATPTSFPTTSTPTSFPTTPAPTTLSPTTGAPSSSPTTSSPTNKPTTSAPVSKPSKTEKPSKGGKTSKPTKKTAEPTQKTSKPTKEGKTSKPTKQKKKSVNF